MKMKTLFFSYICEGMWNNQEEIGIASIASYLRKHDHVVELRNYSEDSIDYTEIQELHPDIIGIPVYDINIEKVYKICKDIKQYLPNTVISVGGALASIYGKEVLIECMDIDLVIIGEGEETFLELLSKFKYKETWKDIKGLIFRLGGQIIATDPRPVIRHLDILPPPSRDILQQSKIKIAQISTSRGCTAECSFCTSKLLWKGWRGKSICSILDEMEYLANDLGIRAYNIIDGSFEDPGFNKERIYDFANGILNRKLVVSYYIQLRAESYKKFSPDMMHALKKSGLSSICIGLEAGNEMDLKLYNKRASLDDMEKAIEFFSGYDLYIDPGFINFNPYSTVERLRKNVLFLKKYGYAANPDYILRKCKIYVGSLLDEQMQRDGRLSLKSEIEYFKEIGISNLYQYICAFWKEKMSTKILGYNIRHGVSINRVYISCMKTLFKNSNQWKALQLIDEYEKEVLQLCEKMNLCFFNWFYSLLDLVEQGWDDSKADLLTEKFIDRYYIKNTAIRFQYLSEKLKKSINKLSVHPDYINLVNYCF